MSPWVARCLAGALAVALLAASLTASAGDPRAASPLALSCTGCHQPSVNSPAMRALDRLPPAAIAESLRRSRDRPEAGSIMARFTSTLSDQDIQQLARQLGSSDRTR